MQGAGPPAVSEEQAAAIQQQQARRRVPLGVAGWEACLLTSPRRAMQMAVQQQMLQVQQLQMQARRHAPASILLY